MGATLEFKRIKAKDFLTAVRKLQDDSYSSDPYSGDFNTCYEFYNYTSKFDDVDQFSDWVEEDGGKREAYSYRYGDGLWLFGGWCAC